MDISASAAHERRKIEAVREAAAVYARTAAAAEQAKDARDRAVRSAIAAGVPNGMVAEAAGLSPGRVSHLAIAPKR